MPLTSYAFPDIVDHSYRESIEYIHSQGVVQGYPDGTYGPDRPITRAEITKIVLEAHQHIQPDSDADCFADVRDQRYARYVCLAKSLEIVQGYPDGTFQPEAHVTIAEGLKIALKSFGMTMERGTHGYRYQPYLEWVIANNLRERYELDPQAEMTRGQMAYLTHRVMSIQRSEHDQLVPLQISPGCQRPNPPSSPQQSSVVDGLTRNYIAVVGSNYVHTRPTKLIFAFHGRTSPAEQVRQYYQLEKKRDADAIVIYPRGLPEGGPSRSRTLARDGKLFDQLLQEFGDQYCIDYDQIYAMGHSLGAWFSHTLACARGDIIRATGSVGGSTSTRLTCTGPTAGIIMHNPNDRLAAFAGGVSARDQRLVSNGCDPDQYKTYASPTNANCVIYDQCRNDPVVRCPHTENHSSRNGAYYPHTRPSFATDEMWKLWMSGE